MLCISAAPDTQCFATLQEYPVAKRIFFGLDLAVLKGLSRPDASQNIQSYCNNQKQRNLACPHNLCAHRLRFFPRNNLSVG